MSEEDVRAPEDLQTPYVCEGGNLDCGSGLLLLIRKAMNGVPEGQVLEIRSTEISVREDLPAWCRMTKNPYLGWRYAEGHHKYFVGKSGNAGTDEESYKKARDFRWQTRVLWNSGAQVKVFCRNHSWTVGQPASFDVQDVAPSAVEYILGALGACLAMGFQIRASQKNVVLDGLEVSLSGKINNIFVFLGAEWDGHSGFEEITGTAYVQSDAESDVLRQLWQETLAASPVVNTLIHNVHLKVGIKTV